MCSAKRLIAAWRVLIGVWGPRYWDLPVSSLKTYTKFIPPPPNPWLDVNKPPKDVKPASTSSETSSKHSVTAAAKDVQTKPSEQQKRKIASRHLVRHVLRARISAAQSLSEFLAEVNHSDGDVRASAHLAARYPSSIAFYDTNGKQTSSAAGDLSKTGTAVYQFLPVDGPTKTRSAREVIKYLKDNGALIGGLDQIGEGDWAAEHLTSGDEGAEVRRSLLCLSFDCMIDTFNLL